jgi:TonB-dependent receptor
MSRLSKGLFLLFICLGISAGTVSAQQNGTIKGKIVDRDGLPMPGASIRITELPTIGTSSDVNGQFTLLSIASGSYTLTVSYIGYTTVSMPVRVAAGLTTTQDFELTEGAAVGDEILILGDGLRGQARALNQQRNNMNITNVVSSDQAGRFPDANIGDALKRISGITIQNDQGEARNIIIRGMAPQLNSVTINGERIPSAEGDNRNIQLDLIPTDMIQSIEVSKAVTPDMEADAIGGSVNLVTRSSPNELRLSGTAASGMNLLTNRPIWTGGLVVGNRFLDGKLGAILSASYNYHDFGSDNVEAVWYKSSTGQVTLDEFDIRKYLVRRERKSTSLSLDYRINDENVLYLSGMYNWRDDWENRYRMRVGQIGRTFDNGTAISSGNGLYNLPARVEFQTKGGIDDDRTKMRRLEDQRNRNVSLGGNHLLGKFKANWSVSYAKSSEDRPNERYLSYRRGGRATLLDISDTRKPNIGLVNPDDALAFGLNVLSEQQGKTFDEDRNARIDFIFPYSDSGYLKFGGRARLKHKEVDNSFNFYRPIDPTLMPTMGVVPISDQSDKNFLPGSQYAAGRFPTAGFLGGLNLRNPALFNSEDGLEEYISGNYEADENVYAGYVMADHRVNKQLSILAGVRLEYTSIDYIGNLFDIDNGTVTKAPGSNSYLNLLPGVHVRYAMQENTIFRFSWTNTIARPNYFDLVPYAEYVAEDAELSRGNPELDATTAMNFDLMAEHYFSNVGMISAGFFYKDVNNFIYEKTLTNYTDPVFGPGLEFTTAANGGTANVYGLEIAFQRQIWKGLGLYMNYTRTESSTTGVEGREDDDLALPGTAKNMLNTSLSYETDKLNLRVSMNYASDYIDELGGEAFEDRFYDKQTFVDVNGSYKFTKRVRLFAEVNNLTNQPLRYYQGVSSRTMQMEYYNVRFNVGIKADLF